MWFVSHMSGQEYLGEYLYFSIMLFLCIISISFGCDCVFTYQLDIAAKMINISSEFPILINIWETL